MTEAERIEKIKAIQTLLGGGLKADGIPGPLTEAAWQDLKNPRSNPWRSGKASSFADPKDIKGFKEAKAKGMTDLQAFKYGDNGIGKWGKDTTSTEVAMCALPPEDWGHLAKPNGTLVEVEIAGRTVICQLQDTMPAKRNVTNGAIIDLNPGAQKKAGLNPPFMVPCRWRFYNP